MKDEVLSCGSWFSQYLREQRRKMVNVTNKRCYEELWTARAASVRAIMSENENNLCAAEPGMILDF